MWGRTGLQVETDLENKVKGCFYRVKRVIRTKLNKTRLIYYYVTAN